MIHVARKLDGQRVVATRRFSIRLRDLVVFLLIAIVALLIALFSLSVGSTNIGTWNALRTLFGGPATDAEAFAIREVRAPRIVLGFLAGACVALAGAIMQALARNPLADPGLLGLSQGALVAVLFALVFLPTLPIWAFPFVAISGGLAVGGLLIVLVGRRGVTGPVILLMGIAIEATLSGVTLGLIVHMPRELSAAISIWLNGSLAHAGWGDVVAFLPWAALGLPLMIWVGWPFRVYVMGDEVALGLGEPVYRNRAVFLIAAVFLTSAATAAVGPLIFLGVIAPQVAGALTRAAGMAHLLLSSMTGGLLVMAADIVSRGLVTSAYIPLGLTLVAFGAPLFAITLRLAMLQSRRRL